MVSIEADCLGFWVEAGIWQLLNSLWQDQNERKGHRKCRHTGRATTRPLFLVPKVLQLSSLSTDFSRNSDGFSSGDLPGFCPAFITTPLGK